MKISTATIMGGRIWVSLENTAGRFCLLDDSPRKFTFPTKDLVGMDHNEAIEYAKRDGRTLGEAIEDMINEEEP